MRTPHTRFTKGKMVWIRLKNGAEIVGRFFERKGKYVLLDTEKVKTGTIAAMNYLKHRQTTNQKR